MDAEEKRMLELHKKYNSRYEKYNTSHELLLKLDLFFKTGGRTDYDDVEEIDRRLKILDAIYNDSAVSFSISFEDWLRTWDKETK